jgi:hypothetical protein
MTNVVQMLHLSYMAAQTRAKIRMKVSDAQEEFRNAGQSVTVGLEHMLPQFAPNNRVFDVVVFDAYGIEPEQVDWARRKYTSLQRDFSNTPIVIATPDFKQKQSWIAFGYTRIIPPLVRRGVIADLIVELGFAKSLAEKVPLVQQLEEIDTNDHLMH